MKNKKRIKDLTKEEFKEYRREYYHSNKTPFKNFYQNNKERLKEYQIKLRKEQQIKTNKKRSPALVKAQTKYQKNIEKERK